MKSSVSIGANIFCECSIHKIDFIEKCKKCKEILETSGRKISVLKDIEKSPQEALFNLLLTGEIELLLNVVSSVFELPLEKIFIRSPKALNNLFDQLLNNIQHYTNREYFEDACWSVELSIFDFSMPKSYEDFSFILTESRIKSEEGKREWAQEIIVYYNNTVNENIFLPPIRLWHGTNNKEFHSYFERIRNTYWYDFYRIKDPKDTSYSAAWIMKLIQLTNQDLMFWEDNLTEFQGIELYYEYFFEKDDDEKDISALIIKTDDPCAIKIRRYNSEKLDRPLTEEEQQFNEAINRLSQAVKEHLKRKANRQLPDEEVKIKKNTVVIKTDSFICKEFLHDKIEMKCGIITIITSAKEIIEKKVYLGCCPKCCTYFISRREYENLCQLGTLICTIYDYKRWKLNEIEKKGNFYYADESIMKAFGYNVNAQSNLTDEERQQIMIEVIRSGSMRQYEVVYFLNWLIRIHENDEKYEQAVGKWEMDKIFISEYHVASSNELIDKLKIH